jgi:hypothetical protein
MSILFSLFEAILDG